MERTDEASALQLQPFPPDALLLRPRLSEGGPESRPGGVTGVREWAHAWVLLSMG